jgi:hypothetical protein
MEVLELSKLLLGSKSFPLKWFSMPFGSRVGCGYFNLIVLGNGGVYFQLGKSIYHCQKEK